jgi:hypothetical protein
LRHEDEDRQRVDEARHHRARNEAHQHPQSECPCRNLQHPRQQGRGQQVLQAVILYQRHHHERHGAGGGRNHSRTPAREGNHDGDAEGRIEPDFRVDAGDDGKGNGFRDQREGDDQAREHIAADIE